MSTGLSPRSPLKRLMHNSPSPPLRGRCPLPTQGQAPAEGGPCLLAYLVVASRPPLCHAVTSPPARGGEGNQRICIRLLKGDLLKAEGVLPPSTHRSIVSDPLIWFRRSTRAGLIGPDRPCRTSPRPNGKSGRAFRTFPASQKVRVSSAISIPPITVTIRNAVQRISRCKPSNSLRKPSISRRRSSLTTMRSSLVATDPRILSTINSTAARNARA